MPVRGGKEALADQTWYRSSFPVLDRASGRSESPMEAEHAVKDKSPVTPLPDCVRVDWTAVPCETRLKLCGPRKETPGIPPTQWSSGSRMHVTC